MRTKTTRPPVQELSLEDGRRMLDEEARKRLGMSGEDFLRAWEAGTFANGREITQATHVAMLIPFAK